MDVYTSHHPSSPPSVKALAMLRASLSAPYPPTKLDAPPLDFNLEVIESKPPTPNQLRTILSYVTPPHDVSTASYATFLSSHPSAPGVEERPQSATDVAELGTRNPNALKWPVVVDWDGGRASVGEVDGVANILEALRQRRDGEGKDEGVVQPKGWFW
ncbi:hypothetical protein JVT61DRAFT_14534 [Boletus reticuloceps]|uniref:Thioredoxin-like protein n=1 Tax=Boletus reticuloceps TaxID=495285 RepID=A0A8I3AAB5_9AGAM|nr:hypothetical protein JVT61DRAFT_14534 [Boletus reticuloceps]